MTIRRTLAGLLAGIVLSGALGLLPGTGTAAHAVSKCAPQPGDNEGPYPGRPGTKVSDPVGERLFGPNWFVQAGSPSDPYAAYYYRDGYLAVDGADARNGNVEVRGYVPFYYIVGAIEARIVVGPKAATPGNEPCVHRDTDRRNDPEPTRSLIP